MANRVWDPSGKKVAQTLTITLRPGFGIQHEGEHIEGGPHTLPSEIAFNLLQTNRADLVVNVGDIEERDPAVENRDPAPKGAKGKR